jgi:hypothetical protein
VQAPRIANFKVFIRETAHGSPPPVLRVVSRALCDHRPRGGRGKVPGSPPTRTSRAHIERFYPPYEIPLTARYRPDHIPMPHAAPGRVSPASGPLFDFD